MRQVLKNEEVVHCDTYFWHNTFAKNIVNKIYYFLEIIKFLHMDALLSDLHLLYHAYLKIP